VPEWERNRKNGDLSMLDLCTIVKLKAVPERRRTRCRRVTTIQPLAAFLPRVSPGKSIMQTNEQTVSGRSTPLLQERSTIPAQTGDTDTSHADTSHADLSRTDKTKSRREITRIYTADGHLRLGMALWREMFQELVDSRELTWRLFLRDFSARFRQSVLGYIWALVPVLITVATFSWLNRSRILPITGTNLPYPLFVLIGMSVWQLFASGLSITTQSLASADTMITKINFPRETLVFSAFGQSIFEFVIRIGLVAIFFAAYHIMPTWTAVLVPLAMIPLCLFTLALGFLFSMVNAVLRDIGHIVTFLITFWMFLTPVVYPAPARDAHSLVSLLNPVTPFVVAAQDLTMHGHLTQPWAYGVGSVLSLVLFLLFWRLFHLTEPRIPERM
jgi:lipopolysaccharide transport system permease protein